MKHIFAILLLGVLLLAGLGQTFSFWWLRASIRSEMKQILYLKLDDKQLTVFNFGKNTALTEGGYEQEFLHENIWYDLVKTEIRNDSLFVFALADHAETHLIKNLAQNIEANLYQQGDTAKKIALTLRSIFSELVLPDTFFCIKNIDFENFKQQHFFYINSFSLPHLYSDFPPPKYLSFC